MHVLCVVVCVEKHMHVEQGERELKIYNTRNNRSHKM